MAVMGKLKPGLLELVNEKNGSRMGVKGQRGLNMAPIRLSFLLNRVPLSLSVRGGIIVALVTSPTG